MFPEHLKNAKYLVADVPLATALSGNVDDALPKVCEVLQKTGMFAAVSEMTAKEDVLQIKVLAKFAASVATTVERFLGRDVPCELPYYLPRGIPFTVLTGKTREAFKFNWFARPAGDGRGDSSLAQYVGVSKTPIKDPENLLNYLGREEGWILSVFRVDERLVSEVEQSRAEHATRTSVFLFLTRF